MKGPIARGTIRTTFVLLLRLLIQAGTLLLVARLLGPDRFGAFAGIAALALMLGTLSTFGSHWVLMGEVSRQPERRGEVLRYAVPTTLACGGILLATYLAICLVFLSDAGVRPSVILAIGASEMWLQALFALPAAEQLALGKVARSQMLQTLPLALRLAAAASVFLIAPPEPLVAYAYGYFCSSLIAVMFATLTMPAPWPRLGSWRWPTRAEMRESAGYAVLNITGNAPAELDKTLAARLLPLAGAGLYSTSARVIGAATLPVVAMMLSALPRLFREGRDQPQRTTSLIRWIFAAALAYSVTLGTVLWFSAPFFVLLFGEKYAGIQQTIRWLCLAIPGMALRMAAGSVLMALARPWMRVGFELGGLIILLIASILLTDHFGTLGMALALSCAEWGMALLGIILVQRVRDTARSSLSS